MKLSNRELVQVYICYMDIIANEKIKDLPKVTGKHIYLISKCVFALKSIYQEIATKEEDLKKSFTNAVNEKTPKDEAAKLSDQFHIDHTTYFDETFQEVEIYKIPLELCEGMQKHLSGPSTLTLFNYLSAE